MGLVFLDSRHLPLNPSRCIFDPESTTVGLGSLTISYKGVIL
jgi:hypothetical protein